MNTYSDFIRGRFTGVSLERDGRLALAPRLDAVFSTGQPVIWSLAQAPDGSIYLATGHRGRLYKITPAGAGSLLWTADQPEIFAVAVDSQGAVYVGTAPDGKVYRIENGKANQIFAPKAKYIWSLATAPNGDLFVGTGEPGNVYRVDNKNGAGELYYESGQAHVTSLAIDSVGQVLAGSEPNGILYRISAKDKAFVLYDSSLPEIRSILPMPDGSIYVAALGGSLAGRSGPLTNSLTSLGTVVVTAPATSITVTDSQAGPDLKPKPETSRTTQAAPTVTMPATSLTELAGVEKSALYRINPDLTVETLWSSKEENAYDLVVQADGRILLSTDGDGRIYGLGSGGKDRKLVLLVQTNEGEATRLLPSSKGLLAATGDMGKLFRLEDSTTPSGKYESPVHDSNSVARWGRITWRSAGGTVRLETRTGNSTRPDNTWSDWTSPVNDLVKSPNARYIQWRAELSGSGAALENVSIAYLPQNNPPLVRSVSVTSQGGTSQKPSATASNTAAYSITVTDTGEAPSTSTGTPSQTVSRSGGPQILVSWQADDPDGDKLAYSLYFRGEDEREWKLLRANMQENSLLMDGDIFADGRYYFRVVASDRPSNAKEYAKEAEQISPPVLIDNTPPVVKLSAPRRTDRHVEVDVEAADQTSALRRCEYSLDAGPWMVVEAADGVTDGPREDFHVVLDGVRPGEHLLVVRVLDSGGNAGLGKVVLR